MDKTAEMCAETRQQQPNAVTSELFEMQRGGGGGGHDDDDDGRSHAAARAGCHSSSSHRVCALVQERD